MTALGMLIPPPHEVQRRAWECAFVLAQEHSADLGDEGRWHFLQAAVRAGHHGLTWGQCGALLHLHRVYAERQRAAGAWGWR